MIRLHPPSQSASRLVSVVRWPVAAALLGLLMFGRVAQAAPPVGAALKKFEEGVAAYAANNFGEALKLFQASMELEPSPNTRFKIAKCYLSLGRTGSAYASFRRAAKEAQDRINATGEQRFVPTRTAAETEAAQIDAQVPRIALKLPADISPELAAELTITLDGEPLPATLLGSPMELDPGPHRVNASGAHITPYEQGFEMAAGETKPLEIAVVRRKAGTLVLSFTKRPAGLAVAIDAQPVAASLVDAPISLGIGLHKVVVSAPNYLDFVSETTLHDQESLPIAVTFLPAPRPYGGPPKALTFVLGGATLAFLGIGIGYGVQAQNTADEQTALNPIFRDPTVRDGVRLNATIANVFFGLGGAFGIATVAVAGATRWHTPARPAKKVASWLHPVVPLALTAAASEGEH